MASEPITDHYGTEIKVESLMGSIGPCVDLERKWVEYDKSDRRGRGSFDRLTPEQARELGERLIEASEARG